MEKTIIKKDNNNQQQRKMKAKNHFKNQYVDEQTGSDTPKKNSFKLRIIQWLKQLPLDERYLAVKVYAPGLSKKIQETLIDFQNDHIQQIKKDHSNHKKITPKQAKQIIQSIVLISDGQEYFDSIGFDFSYIEHPDKLYQLLTLNLSNVDKNMFQSDQYDIQQVQLKETLQTVQKAQTRQQLASSIISFLRADIFIKYQQKKPINLQDERNRKKQFSMFWRNLSEQNKRKILLLHKEDLRTLSIFLEQKKIFIEQDALEKEIEDMIPMDKNQFCNKIFKCKLKRSLTYFTDYHQLIYKTWKNQLNKKKRRQRNHQQRVNNQKPSVSQKISSQINGKNPTQINQKNIKRSNKPIQKQKDYNHEKQKITQNNPKQKNSNVNLQKTSKKINNSSISSNNGANGTLNIQSNNNTANNVPSTNKRKRNRNNRRKKSVSAQSKQTKATSYKVGQEQVQKIQQDHSNNQNQFRSFSNENNIKTQNQQLKKEGINPFFNRQQNPQTLYSDENFSLESTQSPSTKELKIDIPFVNYDLQIRKKLLNDIQQYSDLINQEANQFYQRRIIAYQRIQFILNLWNIPIKLFGSCASGITIKNSDIDIAVDNSILNYFATLPQGQRLRAALQHLQIVFQQQPCVTSLKLIKTAAIPLIKMKIDTSIKFVDIPGFQLFPQYIQGLNRQHISSGQIHIDLTIQTINKELQSSHLGIISTQQINRWLKSIKPLHSIVIIIKNYLTKMNLNITYEGGINTYSMICMLVAFMKHHKYEQESDVVMVFKKLLSFFCFQFDQKTTGIDLLNETQIFYDKLKLKAIKSQTCNQQSSPKTPQLSPSKSVSFCQADLEIKDPLNNGKIMTKNCYSFPKIKQVLKQIYEKCFIQTRKQFQRIFTQRYKQKMSNLHKIQISHNQKKSLRQQNQKASKNSIYIKKMNEKKYSKLSATRQIEKSENKIKQEGHMKKEDGLDNLNIVNQLIEQCKIHISNPFLTLFQ